MKSVIQVLTPSKDTRLHLLMVATAILTLVVLAMALIYGPRIAAGGTAAQEVRISSLVDDCRAQFRGRVDIARSDLATMVAEHATVVAEHNTSLGEALEAIIDRDDAARDVAVARLSDLRDEIDRLNALVDQHAARVRDTAREFQDAADEAVEDRPGFLDACGNGE